MKCYFDNGRQMYICQCKTPKPDPRTPYLREDERRQQSRPSPESEYPLETQPKSEDESQIEEQPDRMSASAVDF